ncbi:MAG: D-tyrosyl-tRNA(Tyr) deacylase [Armatimonadetes bacterium]|nr:D-tyrosyl-tRNA(Tyr) deacylase [Armatimonadota bacterium]
MKAVVQRVSWAKVLVDGAVIGECGPGLLVLVSAHKDDRDIEAAKLADRIYGMRIFNDGDGKMNLSLSQIEFVTREPNILVISNFTVYGDAAKSRRPSFTNAAGYDRGTELYQRFVSALGALGARVSTGEFGADMQVQLENDGPVTLVVDVAPPEPDLD